MAAAASAGAVKSGIINAGKFVGGVAKICGGGGGGKPNMAQAGGKDASAVPKALESAKEQLAEAFK
jgi:alanyl-tRNA synthetase